MRIFFDLDGPILDVSERYYRAYCLAMEGLGDPLLDKREYWECKRQRVPNVEIWKRTGAEGHADELSAAWRHVIESPHLLRLDRVWPEMEEIGATLQINHHIYLVTLRTFADRTHRQLEWLGIRSWFKTVLSEPASGSERWRTKVRMVDSLRMGETSPLGAVFIGDTETDLLAGRELGMTTVGVSFGIRSPSFLDACRPDFVADSPAALADYIRTLPT
jgi:phosphoglycolate phosphatase